MSTAVHYRKTDPRPQRRVRYKTPSGRKMTGIVQDYLPFPGSDRLPILLKTRVVWMDRKDVRLLPA